MKIGINARYLKNSPYGLGTYLENTVLNLKNIDRKNEYLLFLGDQRSIPGYVSDIGLKYDITRFPCANQISKILWSQFYLPYAIKRQKIDIFHEPSFVPPIVKTCPLVITVHDIAFRHLPFCYTYRTRLYLNSMMSLSLRLADSVIAVSDNTRNDILNNFSISPDKVIVVHEGVDDVFRPIRDIDALETIKQKYGIKKDFILGVGALTPRKNFVRLIKAFKLLKDNGKVDLQLVIVGIKAWRYGPIFEEVAKGDLDGDVIFCDHVPKKDMVSLYNAAAVFAYPSLYEGFGLPILESMACGCPVVASNVSSMPEACGDSALLIDPLDVEGLSDAMYQVVTKRSLRQDLVKNGIEHVKRFSWRRTAEETLAVYNKMEPL